MVDLVEVEPGPLVVTMDVEDGRARIRHVETGQRNGVIAEIRAGLEAGSRVVAHPSDRVADGVRIASRD